MSRREEKLLARQDRPTIPSEDGRFAPRQPIAADTQVYPDAQRPIGQPAGHSFAHVAARSAPSLIVQPKLSLGPVDDVYEHEADQIAERVMRMPATVHQQSPPQIQRAAESGVGTPVTPEAQAGISGMRGGGQPLDSATRTFMEPRFGHSFAQVRVHTDARAANLAQQIQARAFTVGSDVAFAPGQYQPTNPEGQRLLAHELTHVVQQGSGDERIQRAFIKDAASDADLFEREPGTDDQPDLSAHTEAKKGKLKITSVAMKHFLERHTFKHQQLTADFRRYDATLWPKGTTVVEVLDGLNQVLKTMEGRTNKNKMVNKIHTVTMGGKSCNVQVGMITGGKLEQFFPVSGADCQQYTKQELAQIYEAKQNKPKAQTPTPSTPSEGEVSKPPASTPPTGAVVTKPGGV